MIWIVVGIAAAAVVVLVALVVGLDNATRQTPEQAYELWYEAEGRETQ